MNDSNLHQYEFLGALVIGDNDPKALLIVGEYFTQERSWAMFIDTKSGDLRERRFECWIEKTRCLF